MKIKKIVKVVSAGGVVFKGGGKNARVCLISRRKEKIWALPKGHVEKGEKYVQTAQREVLEETGLRVAPIRKIGFIRYTFIFGGIKYRKRVHFFLFSYSGGSTENHDSEVDEARWFPFHKVLDRMSYVGEKKIMKMAKQMWMRK